MKTKGIVGAVAVLSLSVLTACAPVVRLEAAPEANSPNCANMIVRLPDDFAGQERRRVNSQATAAWGNPVVIIARCGLPRPAPSTLPCVTVDGVDWLVDDTDRPTYRLLSYGLDPATEVIVDSSVVSGTTVLQDLAGPVASQSAPVAECLDAADVFG